MPQTLAPNGAERSTRPFQRIRYDDDERGRRETERARRIADLPGRCRMLADGLDNSENDPSLVFAGLSFAEVMSAAERDIDVFFAVQRLTDADVRRLARSPA